MKYKKNPSLTAEQKLVLFEDGTEAPGTSELNNEKKREAITVQIVVKSYLILILSMKVDQAGLHFISPYLKHLKPRQILY